MKKLILLVLCLGMAACGYAYYQNTLALPKEVAPEGQGIEEAFCDRDKKPLQDITLFPAVYRDFNPDTDKTEYKNTGWLLWDDEKITGAQDHILRVTNQGATSCYFRTYVAFEDAALENIDSLVDELITVNWGDDFTITPMNFDLTIENDPENVEKYRVYLITTEVPLDSGESVEPMLQIFLSMKADNKHVKALGNQYTIRAVTEALWLTEVESEDYDASILVDLLGEPTPEYVTNLFNLEVLPEDQTEPEAE